MDSQAKDIELDEKLFSPGKDVPDLFAGQPFFADFRVSGNRPHDFPFKGSQLPRGEIKGGSFHGYKSLEIRNNRLVTHENCYVQREFDSPTSADLEGLAAKKPAGRSMSSGNQSGGR